MYYFRACNEDTDVLLGEKRKVEIDYGIDLSKANLVGLDEMDRVLKPMTWGSIGPVIARPEWHLLPLKLHQSLFLTAWNVSRHGRVGQCLNPPRRQY